jgi:hypothetical protein
MFQEETFLWNLMRDMLTSALSIFVFYILFTPALFVFIRVTETWIN